MDALNIFGGSGFVGSAYVEKFPGAVVNDRDDYVPKTQNILYLISTGDNYNVFEDLHKDIDTNLSTLMNVLESISEPKNTVFNFISSWFVYGDTQLPAREDGYCNPKGFYSITKRTAEQLLISYCQTMGMRYRILRLANVVGAKDAKVSAKRNALQYMIQLLKNNEPVDLYEGGHVLRNFIYIDDCVDAIHLVITKGALDEIYNIGTEHATELYSVIHLAKLLLNSQSELRSIPTPEFHRIVQVRSIRLDVTKLMALGFVPHHPMPAQWLPRIL